jgi:gp178
MNKQELIEKYEYLNHDCFRRVDTSEVLKDLKQLDEPEKVKVPQSVVDWIEHFKKCSGTLYGSTAPYSYYGRAITDGFEGDVIEVLRWIRDNSEVYALAWIFGYEVEKEKEKRYLVKMKGIEKEKCYLNYNFGGVWLFYNQENFYGYRAHHTRKELEDAGFGEVFNSPLFEVEEVE